MSKSRRPPGRTSQRPSAAPYFRPATLLTSRSTPEVPPAIPIAGVPSRSGEACSLVVELSAHAPELQSFRYLPTIPYDQPGAATDQSQLSLSTVAAARLDPLSHNLPETSSPDLGGNADFGYQDEDRQLLMDNQISSSQMRILHDPQRFRADNNQADSCSRGFLSNAQGVVINQPIMTEVHQHQILGASVLVTMAKHIIPGTEFDSSERDDPPRCHPDTRTSFLEQLQARIHNATLETRIIWLVGPAGVGKSAIIQSLAEIVCPLPTLRCATLFFSRPNHRDDPKKVFTTLAYRFAVADTEYRRYIEEKLAVDPSFLDKSLDEQFKRLFVIPYTTGGVNPGSRRWVAFLDGFDEIKGEREQRRILDLIRESLLPPTQTTPLLWIIASRPEAHLQASFRRVERQTRCFWKLEVPIDSEEALRSVERYLRAEFARIRDDYFDIVPALWPLENDFLELTKASSGLFIFASTLVDYVGKENPVQRLKHIVSLISRGASDHHGPSYQAKRNPFYALDVLYTTIMSNIPSDSLSTAKSILGFYLLGGNVADDNDLLTVCNICGLEQDVTYAALRKLQSVLSFPSPNSAHKKPVRFLHASFSDFLKDRSRSEFYHIDLDEELVKVWRCYGNILKSAPTIGISGNITLSWEPLPTAERKKLCDLVQRNAQRFWFMILILFCHDPSCRCGVLRHRLSPDTTEVIEVFEDLGVELYKNLWSEFGEEDVKALFDWLSDHGPITLRQRMILKQYDLVQLCEHDTDNMFRGLGTRRSPLYLLHSYSNEPAWFSEEFSLENLSLDRWNQAKCAVAQSGATSWRHSPLNWSALANLLDKTCQARSEIAKVVIVRTKPEEHYAIIGPLKISVSKGLFLDYLICPYVEE